MPRPLNFSLPLSLPRSLPLSLTLALALAGPLTSQAAPAMVLESPGLRPGATLPEAQVYAGMGCTGENRSPALAWRNLPAGTRSLALTVYDPDAPTGSGWWHWVVVNLPASTQALPADAGKPGGEGLPPGSRQVNTDFGQPGYGGACPPPGDKPHHYVFTLHALDTPSLDLPENATAALAGFMIHAHTLRKAQLVLRYGRGR